MTSDAVPEATAGWRVVPGAVALATVVFVLGLLAVEMRPQGSLTAVWWPGAGVAVAWVLHRRRGDRVGLLLAVAVGGGVANVVAGRPLVLAVAFAAANAAEVAVVTGWVGRGRSGRFVLADVGDFGRFLVATLLGGLVAGALAGLSVHVVLAGGFGRTLYTVTFAHAASVLLVAPVVLLSADVSRAPNLPRALELLAQWLVVLTVAVLVFRPGQVLPLAFVCPPVLAWTAVRSGARSVAWQLLVVGVVATTSTVLGAGPFGAAPGGPAVVVVIAQVFIVCCCSTVLVLALHVQERGRLERRVAEREALYRGGFDDALLGMLLVDLNAGQLNVREVNGVGCRLLGATREQLVGTVLAASLLPEDRSALAFGVVDVIAGRVPGWHGQVRTRVLGQVRRLDLAIAPSGDSTGHRVLSVQLVDITERHDAHARLEELALHDPLTTLPNRTLLLDRLELALVSCVRSGGYVALVYIDLDGFKAINDRAGHAAGDQVLVATAGRLRALVRPGDTVARLGGDEFVVLCPSVTDDVEMGSITRRFVAALCRPVVVDGWSHSVGASAGAALGGGTTTAQELLDTADEAMYVDKHRRRELAAAPVP